MKGLAAAGFVLTIVAACAAPAPTGNAPSPGATDLGGGTGATVRFDGWTARCGAVQADDCEGVARLFVNNLARNWKGVLDASAGRIVVEARASCPASLPDWADNSSCWQATAPASTGDVCMVIARHPGAGGAVTTFGQVGGDEMTGRAGGPPSAWPVCD